MRTLTSITDELPVLQDKLALMYADIAHQSLSSFHIHKHDFMLANLYLKRLQYELICGQDIKFINYYYNQLSDYLKLCKNVAYSYVDILMPQCEQDREKVKYWIPGDSICEDSGTIFVSAGNSTIITAPTSVAPLNGIATDDTYGIISTLWEQKAGPNSSTILIPYQLSTQATNLLPGFYIFRLTAINGIANSYYAEKTVTVLPVPSTPLTVRWGFFSSDPTINVQDKSFQFAQTFSSGTVTYSLDFTIAADEKWLVIEEPLSSIVKTKWENTPINKGVIPDSVFKARVVVGNKAYIISRVPVVLDSETQIIVIE